MSVYALWIRVSSTVKVYALRRLAAGSADIEDALRVLESGVDGVVFEIFPALETAPAAWSAGERTERVATTTVPAQGTGSVELEGVLRGLSIEVLLWVRDPQVLDSVARVIERSGLVERAGIVVDDLLHARVVRGASSRVRVVLKMGNPFPNVPLLAKEGVSALALPATVLRPRVVRECASRGLDAYAWLVNDVSQAVRVVRYGVRLLVTSRPGLKRELQQYLGVLGA